MDLIYSKIMSLDLNQILGSALGIIAIYSTVILYRVGKLAYKKMIDLQRLLKWVIRFAENNGFKCENQHEDHREEDMIAINKPDMLVREIIEDAVSIPTDFEYIESEGKNGQKPIRCNITRSKKIQRIRERSLDFTPIEKFDRSENQS